MGVGTLNLVSGSIEGSGFGVRDRENLLEELDNNLEKINEFAADLTGSMVTRFSVSGAIVDRLSDAGFIGASFTNTDRVITEVIAYAGTSGSGGVTRIDVQIQQGSVQPANFSSIFSNNAYKPALSSSIGNLIPVSGSTFVSGSNMLWRARSMLKVIADTAAGATGLSGQDNVTVEVFWKPSGSYGV